MSQRYNTHPDFLKRLCIKGKKPGWVFRKRSNRPFICIFCDWLFEHNHCSLKVTGSVNFTRTGSPFIIPGFHFGSYISSFLGILWIRDEHVVCIGSKFRHLFNNIKYFNLIHHRRNFINNFLIH